MRSRIALFTVAFAMGCDSTEPVELVHPAEEGIEGVYVLARCNFSTPTPPCYTYLSGVSMHILDSARATLSRDGSGSLMTATRDRVCIGSQPCTTDTVLHQQSITYVISADRVSMYPVGAVTAVFDFRSHIPSLVPKGWSGPDTLTTEGSAGGTTRSVTFSRVP